MRLFPDRIPSYVTIMHSTRDERSFFAAISKRLQGVFDLTNPVLVEDYSHFIKMRLNCEEGPLTLDLEALSSKELKVGITPNSRIKLITGSYDLAHGKLVDSHHDHLPPHQTKDLVLSLDQGFLISNFLREILFVGLARIPYPTHGLPNEALIVSPDVTRCQPS